MSPLFLVSHHNIYFADCTIIIIMVQSSIVVLQHDMTDTSACWPMFAVPEGPRSNQSTRVGHELEGVQKLQRGYIPTVRFGPGIRLLRGSTYILETVGLGAYFEIC